MFSWPPIQQVIAEPIYYKHMRNGKAEKADKYCLGKDCAALDDSPTFNHYEDDDDAEEGKRDPINKETPNVGFQHLNNFQDMAGTMK